MSENNETESAGEDPYAELTTYFESRGHGPEEVRKIIGKLRQHDKQAVHDSIMDSIAEGRFNLDEFVRQALSDEGDDIVQ